MAGPLQPDPREPAPRSGVDPIADLPESWVHDIRSLHAAGAEFAAFDAEKAALVHFRNRRQRMVMRWSAAAAAGLAIGVSVWAWRWNAPGTGASRLGANERLSVAMRGDLNADGVINMLDALLLARAVEGGSTDLALDLNADRIVDRADVDRLAGAAVNLDGAKL